jgi:hypothetical protein
LACNSLSERPAAILTFRGFLSIAVILHA